VSEAGDPPNDLPNDLPNDPAADLVVGLGARPGVRADQVRAALAAALERHGLAASAVRAYATLAARAGEPGLRAVAGPGLLAYPSEALAAVIVPRPDPRVAAAVGTPSVAEAAALRAASELAPVGGSVELVAGKSAGVGVTVAVARILGP
jgi:cobalamin biosynthesis protein CbiG